MSNTDKVTLSFPDITRRLKALTLPEVDLVVGVATGGTVPASLVAYELARPLRILTINYRDEDNQPRREAPELLELFTLLPDALLPDALPPDPLRILLVDDVSVSGKTLAVAKHVLHGHTLTTLVFKGKGDLVVLPEVASCVVWPWQAGVSAKRVSTPSTPLEEVEEAAWPLTV